MIVLVPFWAYVIGTIIGWLFGLALTTALLVAAGIALAAYLVVKFLFYMGRKTDPNPDSNPGRNTDGSGSGCFTAFMVCIILWFAMCCYCGFSMH